MNAKILDAVGLIGKYVSDHLESSFDHAEIKDELLSNGFSTKEISDAFKWIEINTLGSEEEMARPSNQGGTTKDSPPLRVLNAMEQSKILPAAWGLVQKLYNRGLYSSVILEEIIERAMQSESDEIDEKEVKRIAALTLFTRVQAEWKEFLHSTNTLIH